MSERNPWQPGHQTTSAVTQLRQQMEAIQEVELARALDHLEHLDERDRAIVRQFGQRMVDELLQ